MNVRKPDRPQGPGNSVPKRHEPRDPTAEYMGYSISVREPIAYHRERARISHLRAADPLDTPASGSAWRR